jgi:micrococcal nuclease
VRPLALIAVFIMLSACSDLGGTEPTTPGPFPTSSEASPPSPDLDRRPAGDPATEVRVLDGDSLEAAMDGEVVEIRLLGINAPERDECWDDEARAALAEAVTSGPVLIDGLGGRDRYGRVLAYLWNETGRLVNLDLVAEGHAVALTGDHPEAATFLAAEDVAYAARLGFWEPEACGAATGAIVEVEEISYDPPGRDAGIEYLRLRNDGAGPVDLGGWTIRDETSSHRFVFPAGTTVAPGGTVTLRSGCGDDGEGTFWWECGYDPVWSNDGDVVLLLDRHGNVVLRHRYS